MRDLLDLSEGVTEVERRRFGLVVMLSTDSAERKPFQTLMRLATEKAYVLRELERGDLPFVSGEPTMMLEGLEMGIFGVFAAILLATKMWAITI
jgi:hypothetical protein